MKHVFYIGSHLTFYIAHKIISLDELSTDDCVFFLIRNYHIPEKYNNQYKNQIQTSYNLVGDKSSRIFAGLNFIKTKKNIDTFDDLIDSYLDNDNFIFYTSVCSNDFASLMITKKKCIAYYVIEDGLSSYSEDNSQTFTGWRNVFYKLILRPFFYRLFAIKDHFISSNSKKFKGCIASNEMCFPLHQKYLRVIGIPFEKDELDFTPQAILSIDPLYLFINMDTIRKVYKKLGDYIKTKSYNVIAYKFHPNFYAEVNANLREQYYQVLTECFGKNMIELSQDTVLENVLMTYPCDFYTDNSSVAIYGYVAGARCYSYIPILNQYTDVYKCLPSIFNKVCIPIDLIAKN